MPQDQARSEQRIKVALPGAGHVSAALTRGGEARVAAVLGHDAGNDLDSPDPINRASSRFDTVD